MPVFWMHHGNTLRQLEKLAGRAHRDALMADGQVGYVMPTGGVAAYRDQVSVVGSASISPAGMRRCR